MLDHGLYLYKSPTSSLTSYTDENWGGVLILVDRNQATLSRSSVEAEYHGVTNVVFESYWLREFLLRLYYPVQTATLVYYYNVNVIYLSEIQSCA